MNTTGTLTQSQPPGSPVGSRRIEQRVTGAATSDGAGVRLTRLIGQDLQSRLDPFLMLDWFGSDRPDDYIAGFPNHPHRGFETVTLMLEGRMRHRDSTGRQGLLETGGVQWMVAGRGIVHSEMPEQTQGRMAGFQLWLNLPAPDKLCDPWYRDINTSEIPVLMTDQGVRVRIISGIVEGVEGALKRPFTEPIYLDLEIPDGASFAFPFGPEFNAFVVPYVGAVLVGDDDAPLGPQTLGILDNPPESCGVVLRAMGSGEGARVILVAGRPLRESIVQYGPFVMNTEAEIIQAVADYRAGKMG